MAAGVVGAVAVTMATGSTVLARRSPELAIRLWPTNSVALATQASLALQGINAMHVPPQAGSLAARALRYDPGNVAAARVMAVSSMAAGNPRGARWLAYGEQFSRRDLATEVAQIEISVAQGDVKGALRHYDRALRTGPGAYDQLFPVLESAVSTPQVRVEVIRLLRLRPDWRRAFVQQLIVGKVEPAALYDIAAGLRLDPADPTERDQLGAIVQKLVRTGAAASAQRLLPAGDVQPIRNGGFERPNLFAPFDWQLQDDVDLGAVQESGPASRPGNVLYLTARNGRGGEVATQYLTLAPGRYAVSLSAGDTSPIELDRPQLSVRCDIGSRELLRVPVPQVPVQGRRVVTVAFTVAPDCAAQWLSVRLSSPSINEENRPWVDDIALVRPAVRSSSLLPVR